MRRKESAHGSPFAHFLGTLLASTTIVRKSTKVAEV
jgi:hypothetical protein